MAKGQNIVQGGGGRKPTILSPRPTPAAAPVAAVNKRVGPIQFLREVRAEARKVTWTSWKETWITSIMVGVMVVVTAVFFFGVDWILGLGISAVLKLANAE
jgi:preprotein translocase subunit SecE